MGIDVRMHHQGLWLGGIVFVLLGILVAGLTVILGIRTTWIQWIRTVAFGIAAAVYTIAFFYLGVLVLQRKRPASAWLLPAVWAAMLLLTVAVNFMTVISDSAFGSLPEPSTDLRRAPYRSEERRRLEIGYFDEVAAYADGIRQSIHRQYQHERWLHILSPVLLLEEIGGQLLQSTFPTATDVLYSLRSLDTDGSIARSLLAAWPEWVGLLFSGSVLGVAVSRRDVKKKAPRT